MSDLSQHQTKTVQLIFLEMGKSDFMHVDHNCMDNILVIVSIKYTCSSSNAS